MYIFCVADQPAINLQITTRHTGTPYWATSGIFTFVGNSAVLNILDSRLEDCSSIEDGGGVCICIHVQKQCVSGGRGSFTHARVRTYTYMRAHTHIKPETHVMVSSPQACQWSHVGHVREHRSWLSVDAKCWRDSHDWFKRSDLEVYVRVVLLCCLWRSVLGVSISSLSRGAAQFLSQN